MPNNNGIVSHGTASLLFLLTLVTTGGVGEAASNPDVPDTTLGNGDPSLSLAQRLSTVRDRLQQGKDQIQSMGLTPVSENQQLAYWEDTWINFNDGAYWEDIWSDFSN
ncbi:hypothetical protein L3556_06790 [Candidatus Synechococcus calcipolaris G9]|uniref:Uncharacterized protein n=1 Tax=Candidatus Synechococcus calcipolaris G9 TaxID=1497997 RepID=A0ABT6EXX7_9SYNE|nr:hypothetical protein [Candidatus Synechococcus calcipolaris]MDG2990641.1 hypothetical protein [Candidatus Synechococcus calcipolaris G9]